MVTEYDWQDEADYSSRLVIRDPDRYVAILWYGDNGGWAWRLSENGWEVRTGAGCIDRKEARRECDALMQRILDGEFETSTPGKASAERQALAERLLAARARGQGIQAVTITGTIKV